MKNISEVFKALEGYTVEKVPEYISDSDEVYLIRMIGGEYVIGSFDFDNPYVICRNGSATTELGGCYFSADDGLVSNSIDDIDTILAKLVKKGDN